VLRMRAAPPQELLAPHLELVLIRLGATRDELLDPLGGIHDTIVAKRANARVGSLRIFLQRKPRCRAARRDRPLR
jgi:hypothetical protein